VRKGEEHVGEMQVIISIMALFFHTSEAFVFLRLPRVLHFVYVAKDTIVIFEVELGQY
jgi:hypothetical protein